MSKIICLYGLPASGKTTQAERLIKELKFIQFGMGDRLRSEIQSGSDLGKKIKSYVDQGTLITDELMSQIITNIGQEIKKHGIVFDGFPRMLSQAKMLEKIANKFNLSINTFFYLKISPETAMNRLTARAKISKRSDDQDSKAIYNRFEAFNQESTILIKYYQKQNKLIEINGELSIEEVYKTIKKYL